MVLDALSFYVGPEELSVEINVSPRHNGAGAIETAGGVISTAPHFEFRLPADSDRESPK